jgi:hypothetical protein
MIDALVWLPLDVLVLLCFSGLGWLLLRVVRGHVDLLSVLSTALGLGAGLATFILFIISWIGVPLNRASVTGTVGLLAGGLSVMVLLRARRDRQDERPVRPGVPPERGSVWGKAALWSVVALLVLTAAVLSVGLSYHTWDDIHTWAVGGYGIALEGSVFALAHWGDAGLLYPLNAQLMIAVFRIIDGDLLPGSKLLFPAFYLCLLIGCYRFLRKRSVGGVLAAGAMVVLAGTPIMFLHATMGYTNLMFTFYLVTGALWCEQAATDRAPREAVVGGMLIAMAIWTRPEGLIMAAAVLGGLLLSALVTRRSPRPLLPATIPTAVVGFVWSVFFRAHGTGTVHAYTDLPLAIRGIAHGQIDWGALYTIVRFVGGQTLRFRDWGWLPALLGVGLVVGVVIRWRRWTPTEVSVCALAVLTGLVTVGAHYMAAYSPEGPDFLYTWLALGFTRVLMPSCVFLLLLVVLLFGDKAHEGQGGHLSALTGPNESLAVPE